MIVVIQCAASKRPNAGRLRARDGRPVLFVANPDMAPPDSDQLYARPDDLSDAGVSWRQLLLRRNLEAQANPLGLTRAWELYEHPVYRRLVEWFGADKVYILSAGWGLIGANFLTPDYDITYSASAEPYKRRRKSDACRDFCMIAKDNTESILFFGGKDYVTLFCNLTKEMNGTRRIFYNSATAPDAPGCNLIRYQTSTRTNWHYECTGAFLDGRITVAN
jgi:hypothetical protein